MTGTTVDFMESERNAWVAENKVVEMVNLECLLNHKNRDFIVDTNGKEAFSSLRDFVVGLKAKFYWLLSNHVLLSLYLLYKRKQSPFPGWHYPTNQLRTVKLKKLDFSDCRRTDMSIFSLFCLIWWVCFLVGIFKEWISSWNRAMCDLLYQ